MRSGIINLLLGLLANGVRFYAIKRFIDIFFSKDEYQWKHPWIMYVTACIWTSLIYGLFLSPTLKIISNLTGLALIVLPYRAKLSRKLLIVFMIYAVNVLVDSMIIASFTKYITGEPIDQIYQCVSGLVILLFAVILEKTISAERDIHLPLYYRVALSFVPVISIVCIYYLDMTVMQFRMTVIIVSAGILFINILIFYLYNSMVQVYSACVEKKMFEQMAEIYAHQLDLARDSEERVTALRHDMKHHIIALSALAEETKIPEMIKYLHDMKKFMLNPEEHVSTGNKEIDGVLNYLLQKADEVLTHVDVKIHIPEKIRWTDFNICVILGNLVDNAIREASSSKEKYLEISIQSKQEILFIFIENSYSGDIMENHNKLKSSQVNPAIHGIGLENVKKIVRANGGEMNIDYADNRFKVQVLLYLSNII